jgi:hypothetical protein
MTRVINYVITLVATSLSVVILAMVGVMLYGLFHTSVDNEKVFELIGPAFQTIIGGMIGILSGIKLGKESD